jgi:transcriptional regulator with XRE-family HTH domain
MASRGSGPTPLLRELGDRIKDHRLDKGMTQAELAFKSGIHPTYIGSLETGGRNPSVDLLARLAKALDMDLGELVRGLQRLKGRRS